MVNSKLLRWERAFSRGTGGFISKMFTDTDKTHMLEFMFSYLKMPSVVRGSVMNETLTKDL